MTDAPQTHDQNPPRYIMIGGFLGAGKTTAIGQLAQRLVDRGLRVGLITNDQSSNLVDTAIQRRKGFEVEEIAGGCFCCRFDSLHAAAHALTESTRPDVFLAEPVGSCTDLVATVSYPLRRIYGSEFSVAPYSVLVDPVRARRVFGLVEGRSFSEKVTYVYRKQLEEADLIVINKIDRVSAGELAELERVLSSEFPNADVVRCSALHGEGLDRWFDRIESGTAEERATMAVDYQTYAEGEALLGWLNCTVRLSVAQLSAEGGADPSSPGTVDGNALLLELTDSIAGALTDGALEVAHLKMTLDSAEAGGNLAVVSLVASEIETDVRESLLDGVSSGSLIINLRAEADPEILEAMTRTALTEAVERHPGLLLEMEHVEAFRPGKPVPQHRVEVAG